MFVIYRVELVVVDKSQKVRELHCDDTAVRKKALHPIHKVPNIGNMSQNVVADDQVGGAFVFVYSLCRLDTEKCYFGLNALFSRCCSCISSWLNSEDWNADLGEMLEEITIITGQLDDQTRLAYAVIGLHVLAVASRMLDPAIRVRREVRVLIGEDLVGCYIFVELHKEALIAYIGM